jgi:hypothetical protein
MRGKSFNALSRSMAAVSAAVKQVGLLGRGDLIRALKELGPDARVTDAMSSTVSTVTASCAAPILSICRCRCRDMWPIAAVRLAQQLLIDASGRERTRPG